MAPKEDVLRGTLDLLILQLLEHRDLHGWAISEQISELSEEILQVGQGALYPALHRLEKRRLVTAVWGRSENNRRAKYYRITRSGEKELVSETERWERLARAVKLVLRGAANAPAGALSNAPATAGVS